MSFPAGRYYGGVGSIMVQPTRGPTELSRSGLAFRQNIVDDYLGRAGLSTRGDGRGTRLPTGRFGSPSPLQMRALGNLCDGGGAAASSLFTAAGGSTGTFATVGAGTGDSGWSQAGSVAGSISSLIGTVIGTVNDRDCAAVAAAQASQTPTPTSGDAQLAQYQAALAAAMAQSSTAQSSSDAAALAAREQAAQTQRMMLIGGGVLGALLLVGVGVAVFRK